MFPQELAQKIKGYQEQIASLNSKCKMLTMKAKHATMLLTVTEVEGLSEGMEELDSELLPTHSAHPSVVMVRTESVSLRFIRYHECIIMFIIQPIATIHIVCFALLTCFGSCGCRTNYNFLLVHLCHPRFLSQQIRNEVVYEDNRNQSVKRKIIFKALSYLSGCVLSCFLNAPQQTLKKH